MTTAGGCSNRNHLLRSAGQSPLYISHHYSIDEEVDLLWGHEGLAAFPPAVLLLSGVTQRLSPPVLGHDQIPNLFKDFARRGVQPDIFLVLYASGKVFDQICSGQFNADLDTLAGTLRSYGGTVNLAIGLQPNSAMLPTSPEQFVPGYECVQAYLSKRGLPNVNYGLYLFGLGPNLRQLPVSAWYPTGARVDWIGTTGNRMTSDLMMKSQRFRQSNHAAILELAERNQKPLYILDADPITLGIDPGIRGDSLFQNWYVPTLEYVKDEPRILGFCHQSRYIAEDSIIAARVRRLLSEWSGPDR